MTHRRDVTTDAGRTRFITALAEDADGLALGQVTIEHPFFGTLTMYQFVELMAAEPAVMSPMTYGLAVGDGTALGAEAAGVPTVLGVDTEGAPLAAVTGLCTASR